MAVKWTPEETRLVAALCLMVKAGHCVVVLRLTSRRAKRSSEPPEPLRAHRSSKANHRSETQERLPYCGIFTLRTPRSVTIQSHPSLPSRTEQGKYDLTGPSSNTHDAQRLQSATFHTHTQR